MSVRVIELIDKSDVPEGSARYSDIYDTIIKMSINGKAVRVKLGEDDNLEGLASAVVGHFAKDKKKFNFRVRSRRRGKDNAVFFLKEAR